MSGARRAWLFEAKGIQKFILAGGRLVDMAGGSALIARAVRSDGDDLLSVVMEQTGFKPVFSRRAGAAFMLHYDEAEEEKFQGFRALWCLVFSLYAPGVEYTERFGSSLPQSSRKSRDERDVEALNAAYEENAGVRHNSLASLLPIAGPLAARSARTGLPATRLVYDEGIDMPTLHRRKSGKNGRQVRGFMSDEMAENFCWPVHMEKPGHEGWNEAEEPLFPFKGEDRRVGIVHADISGLGQLYRDFGEGKTASERLELATAIEKMIMEAAQKAASDILAREFGHGALPARPILLGGDDLTIIVRADLALAYARVFLETLEGQSQNTLRKFGFENKMLTACAGIAFGRHNQPFGRLLELAEELCSFAKKHVKAGLKQGEAIPSAIAFYRQTTSLIATDMAEILAREATSSDGKRLLSSQPYLVGGIGKEGLFRLADLEELKDWLGSGEVSRGRPRQLRRLLLNDPDGAGRDYRRWREILEKRGQLDGLDERLGVFGIPEGEDLPFADRKNRFDGHMRVTPLFDALEWLALGGPATDRRQLASDRGQAA